MSEKYREDKKPLLMYDQVEICYDGKTVAKDISFSLLPGEILGIAGESGSGKSTVIRAALRVLGQGGKVKKGKIWFQGMNLLNLSEKEMRMVRGAQIGMIFQDAGSSFCPVRTIGSQIHEIMAAHEKISRKEADERALVLFEKLKLRDGKRILNSCPFELSGGMNQRACIAAAILSGPSVILADEPTSALDVSAQRQVLDEMLLLREMYGTAFVLVSHNIGVISAMADTVMILRRGKIEEYGTAEWVLTSPKSAYTKELLSAVPRLRR